MMSVSACSPLPSAVTGSRKEPGSIPKSVRSTGVPLRVFALTIMLPKSSASWTSGCMRHACACSSVTTERENAESALVSGAKANVWIGVRCKAETPSLTRPDERPDRITIKIEMRATTAPIKRNRFRANHSSRRARNIREAPKSSVRVTPTFIDALSKSYRQGVEKLCEVRYYYS